MTTNTPNVDLYQFVSWQIDTLKAMGTWFFIPFPVKSLSFFKVLLIKTFIGISVFIIPTGGQLIYLIRLAYSENADVQVMAGMLNLIITELLITIKLLDFIIRRNSIKNLIKQMTNVDFCDFTKDYKKTTQTKIFITRCLFIFILGLSAVDIAVHVLVVPGLHGFQYLPLKMDFIYFDVNDKRYFNYIFAYQILYKPIISNTFACLTSMRWGSEIFATSQIENLIHTIENVERFLKYEMEVNNCDKNEAFERFFKKCVMHHNLIIRFVGSIQDIYGGHISMTMILSSGIICSTAVQFSAIEHPLNNITDLFWVFAFMVIFVSVLYADCYFGNGITTKNFEISHAIYGCPWVDLSRKHRKNVLIFIARTQQPLVLYAVVLAPVSLETFTQVMNWTYKGFALLNQTK
ncbi:unnamed protein product [Parnassius mnemosyne]|uniref:Odorant receptor n=1 Tax=Parnassius mnemosyne TaxID=213953 RepID=A0AAV1KHI2_9NEOP